MFLVKWMLKYAFYGLTKMRRRHIKNVGNVL